MSEKWQGTSLILTNIKENLKFIECLENEGLKGTSDEYDYSYNYNFTLDYLEDEVHLFNLKKHFVKEDDFLKQARINMALLKFDGKVYSSESKVYSEVDKEFKIIKTDCSDLEKYCNVIYWNIIDGGGPINFKISVNVLNQVLNNSRESRVFLDVLILFAIANRVYFGMKNVEAKFRDGKEVYQVDLNINESKPINLYPLYSWIFNEDGDIDLKISSLRKEVVKKKNLSDVENLLIDSKKRYKKAIFFKNFPFLKF